MRTTRALLLAALLLLPLLPAAEAAGPEPRPWTGYATTSETQAIAMAREGTTIGVALREAQTQTPSAPIPLPGLPGGTTPGGATTDLVILDHEYGHARDTPVNPPPAANEVAVPQGRSHVAVSRDGSTVATLGVELGPAGGGGPAQNEHLRLYYARITPGGNWSGSTPIEARATLGGTNTVTPIGLALSDDGTRVAVLTAEGANYVLRGYTGGSSVTSSFQSSGVGVPRALAATGDLTRLLVVGQFASGNFTYGGGKVFPFAQADAVSTFFETSANNTDARGAAMSRDGSVAAIGGGDGRLFVFRNARDSLATPAILPLGSGALANLSMSEDGTRLASALGPTLHAVDLTGAPRALWNATLTGANTTLALNRTGGLILAATSGQGGTLYAFSDVEAQPLWTIPGDTRGVAVDSAGTRVAYALRAGVAGAKVPRAFTMDLTAGGKLAPQQTVTSPGELSVSVTLRNDGGGMERIVFEETSPDANISSPAAPVDLRPGAITRVNLTISVAAGLTSPRVFDVSARSLTSGLSDSITVSIAPRPTRDVKLLLNETDLLAEPGRATTVVLTVVNNGTGDAEVEVRADQTVSGGALWNVTLDQTRFVALRGTRATVSVIVTPPATVANGTSSTLQFTLQGQDVFDTARVTFRVNPELRVLVNATPPSRYIAPGERGYYNVTVTNVGSLPRDFEIFYTITEDSDRQWGIDLQSQTVRLEPNARRVIPVTITAPANAQPDERVALFVAARSIAEPGVVNDTIVNDNVTIFAIAVAPKVTTPTTPDNDVPVPSPMLAVAAVALIALLSRRRLL